MTPRPRHVSATYLAARTGLTPRWFTGQACEGRIPGAVQPSGPGGAWRFDEARFNRWWRVTRAHKKWRKPVVETFPGHRIINEIIGFDRRKIKMARGNVYFVIDGHALKIGWARNSKNRLPRLQTGNPRKLTLLGTIIGSRAVEAGLHKYFPKRRLHGEWFKATTKFVETINSIIAIENEAAKLPLRAWRARL